MIRVNLMASGISCLPARFSDMLSESLGALWMNRMGRNPAGSLALKRGEPVTGLTQRLLGERGILQGSVPLSLTL